MFPSLSSQAAQQALLEWAERMLERYYPNQDPELRVKKPENLFDGAVFSALLEILDNEYNPSRFQESFAAYEADGDIVQGRRRNLHIIHVGLKDLGRRWSIKVEQILNFVDFQAIAKEPTKTSMYEILVIFACAACYREDGKNEYIQLVMSMETPVVTMIFTLLNEVEYKVGGKVGGKAVGNADGDSKAEPNQIVKADDDDLAQEAALVKLQREVEEAKRQAGGLKLRLDRLQDNYDELIRKHEELQDENEQLHKQIESEVGNFDKHRLQRQLKENESLIAILENERNSLIDEKERLLKDKARLELVAQKNEALIDENQELRSRNEDLSKKANTADNLRKKLESMRLIEADLKSLQNERVDAAKLVEQLENATRRMDTLKREAEAYAKKMQGYEIDIANFNSQKNMYALENNELRSRLEDLQARSQIDEAVVRDLQEKVLMLDPSAAPSTPLGPRPATLEDELNESTNAMSMRNLEVQRLQAENAVLKSSLGTETEKGQLIQEMEDLRVSRQALQERFNEILEKYTVGQHQLDALIQNMGENGLVTAIQACYDLAPGTQWLMSNYFREEAYSNLRTQVLAEQNHSKQLETQLASAKEQLSDKERALLEARGDCKIIFQEYVLDARDADIPEKVHAVEKSSLDALAELKKTDGMLAVSLRAELDAERRKYKSLKDEFEAQRSQLLTAFIEKDELRREAETANRELQRAADGHTVSTDHVKQSEKMEKLRTRYKQLQQVSPSSALSVAASSGSDDEDDSDVVKVSIRRQSIWDAFKPLFGRSRELPESGFYPCQVNDDGSISTSSRPASKMALHGGGNPRTDPSVVSSISRRSSRSTKADPIEPPVL
ncbi:hypothetical protein AAE478_006136 [Parahypoxylon ruwenzoriense]